MREVEGGSHLNEFCDSEEMDTSRWLDVEDALTLFKTGLAGAGCCRRARTCIIFGGARDTLSEFRNARARYATVRGTAHRVSSKMLGWLQLPRSLPGYFTTHLNEYSSNLRSQPGRKNSNIDADYASKPFHFAKILSAAPPWGAAERAAAAPRPRFAIRGGVKHIPPCCSHLTPP